MMTRILLSLIPFLFAVNVTAQGLYFPPKTGNTWDTVSPASLGWCEDSIPQLLQNLDASNSKAFIVLKDGKIVIEAYFDGFTKDSIWYWASAGKSLTAFLVGLAQEQGYLNIDDKTSDYLGTGWSSAPSVKEDSITVWHQLTMTTGLDDGVDEPNCTLDTCLVYLADAGTRWAYHNAPYTLLDSVMEAATGRSLNLFLNQQLQSKTGMTGAYVQVDYNNVHFSIPRSMARFGLLALNKGKWDQTVVMNDTAYFNAMTNTSQNINLSYGYLWWLNGKASYRLPQTQFTFTGSAVPNAPADMFAALGKNGQIINVVPSMGLVVVRMGDAPGTSYFVPNSYNDSIWRWLNPVLNCAPTAISKVPNEMAPKLYPNPASGMVTVSLPDANGGNMVLFSLLGELVLKLALTGGNTTIDVVNLPKGVYLYQVESNGNFYNGKLIVE
jgi:CubicO group peptidase (beta-lactamase class C family)